MQVLKMQVTVKATVGREFDVLDIFKVGSDLVIDVVCKNDDDLYDQDLPVIGLSDLKDLSYDDRQSFIDKMDYKGEHTTEDTYIPFDVWLDDINKTELIDYVESYIIKALDEAIQNKLL